MCDGLMGSGRPQVPKMNSTSHMVAESYFAALLIHPNIVKHLETFIHDGNLIVAMELCAVRAPRSRISPPLSLAFSLHLFLNSHLFAPLRK